MFMSRGKNDLKKETIRKERPKTLGKTSLHFRGDGQRQ